MIPPQRKVIQMTAKIHRVHFPNVGEGIMHIPGGSPYTYDAEKECAYGSYVRFGNRGFVYAKVGTGGVESDIGAKTSLAQKIGNVAIQTAVEAGDTELKITSNVSVSANELNEGTVVVFPAGGGKSFTRGIVSHDVMTATDTLTLQLDAPMPVDVAISGSSAEVMASPYSSVRKTSSLEWNMVMGIPVIGAVAGKYLWLQVEGPAWVVPFGTVGDAVNEQEVTFAGDGSLRCDHENGKEAQQHAGCVICPAVGGTGQGAPFVMLQIAH